MSAVSAALLSYFAAKSMLYRLLIADFVFA